MDEKDNTLSVHLAEYQQLRAEVCLRIELQDKALSYAILVTGFLVAALTGWVLADPMACSNLLKATEANLKGIALLTGHVIALELLLCSWIYHTYSCLHIYAYLGVLARRIDVLLSPAAKRQSLQYQDWFIGESRQVILRGFYRLTKYLQPLFIYGLVFLGIAGIAVLCIKRSAILQGSWDSVGLLAVPAGLLLVVVCLLILHFHTQRAASPSLQELSDAKRG